MTSRASKPTRRVAVLIASVLAASLVLLAAPAHAQGGDVGDWLSRINSLRSSKGLAPLQLDGNLSSLAQGWADHLAAQGSLSHAPDLSAGVTADWTKLGENVGLGPNSATIMNAFINSAPHYANLVDPAYNYVGIGVTWSGGTQFVVHRFMAAGGGGGSVDTGGSPPEPPPAPAPRARQVAPVIPVPTTEPPPPEEPPAPVVVPPPAAPGRVAAMLDALRVASS